MGSQLLVLALFAAQVPLAARYPPPAEDSVAAAVLLVQVVGIILLGPTLVPSYRSVAAAGSGAAVVVLAATLLAGHATAEVFSPLLLLTLWLFAVVKNISPKLQALLAALTIAGPAILWAKGEAGSVGSVFPLLNLSPSVGAISTCLHLQGWIAAFAVPVLLILAKPLQKQALRSAPNAVQ